MTNFNLTSRLLLLAAACSRACSPDARSAPSITRPRTQAPPAYKESPANVPQQAPAPPASTTGDPTLGGLGDWTVAQPQDASLRGKWWEIYNDPELNALEEQLNINNQNIKQFFENFMAARAIVRQAHAQLFPMLTARRHPDRVRGVRPTRPPPAQVPGPRAHCLSCPPMPPGSLISGAKYAIPYARHSTPPSSAPPISKTSVSPSRPAWRSFLPASRAGRAPADPRPNRRGRPEVPGSHPRSV